MTRNLVLALTINCFIFTINGWDCQTTQQCAYSECSDNAGILGYICSNSLCRRTIQIGIYYTYTRCPEPVQSCQGGYERDTSQRQACKICTSGKYSLRSPCTNCPAGTYTGLNGASTCILCNEGANSNAGMSNCTLCIPGTYNSIRGNSKCLSCDIGSFQNQTNGSTCQVCFPGTYQSSTAQTVCNSCQSGSYSNTSKSTSCLICNQGTYQTSNSSSTCLSCPMGTHQSSTGQTKCNNCQPGTFSNTSSASTCFRCQSGTFQSSPVGTVCLECNPCQIGTFKTNDCTILRDTECNICTGCNIGEYASAFCTITQNTQCAPCNICPIGEYADGACESGDFMGLQSQPHHCATCATCETGKFLVAGCVNNAPPECATCSTCPGETILECTSMSDTVCPNVVHCRQGVNYTVYPWLSNYQPCPLGRYITGINPTTLLPSCAQCPDGLYGPNGLWCDRCPGYKTPYFDGSICVCHPSTSPDTSENCLCGPGREFLSDGCVPCPQNTYSNESISLGDEWWDQLLECKLCPAGKYSAYGASECLDCPDGFARGFNESGLCSLCEPGFYHKDPTDPNSCEGCDFSCNISFYGVMCPSNPLLFICKPCQDVPLNALRINRECEWTCEIGFYRLNNSYCELCENITCPPGFNISECTDTTQPHCDNPCVDPDMPLEGTHYTQGCSWECNDGLTYKIKDYGMWRQHLCVLTEADTFWDWG